MDLTQGSIAKKIVLFSLPLLIGNLFQQLYNTVDSYVVGNYVSKYALAAVGASTPVINILVGVFMGFSVGGGVVIAQYYGAKYIPNMRKAIHSALGLTAALSFILTAVGVLCTRPILRLIGVPEDVFPLSAQYLSVYFAGIAFTFFYNMGAGILRAVGDSKRPLYFLILSSCLNIALDFLFVRGFRLGVLGVAIGTLIAQGISAFLVLLLLLRSKEDYRVRPKELRMDKAITRKILGIGMSTGLQGGIIPLSNVVMQSYINVFGASVMAGYSVGIRIDGFVLLALQAFNMAITTFVGQNIGAGRKDRVKKGALLTWAIATAIILVFIGLMYAFGIPFISLFNREPDVVAAGWTMMSTFLPFYPLMVVNQVVNGALKGAGQKQAKIAMCLMVSCFVLLRQAMAFVVSRVSHDLGTLLFWGWPVTWVVCTAISAVYFFKGRWLESEKF